MRTLLVLLIALVLSGCGTARREPTPTPTKTPTRPALAGQVIPGTPTPLSLLPTPAAASVLLDTAAGVDGAAAERLLRILLLHGGVHAGLLDLATSLQAGTIDGLEGLGALFTSGPLAGHAAVARQQQAVLDNVVGQWLDKQIDSASVPGLLASIDPETALREYATALQAAGLTQDELAQMVQRLDEDMQAMAEGMEELGSIP